MRSLAGGHTAREARWDPRPGSGAPHAALGAPPLSHVSPDPAGSCCELCAPQGHPTTRGGGLAAVRVSRRVHSAAMRVGHGGKGLHAPRLFLARVDPSSRISEQSLSTLFTLDLTEEYTWHPASMGGVKEIS